MPKYSIASYNGFFSSDPTIVFETDSKQEAENYFKTQCVDKNYSAAMAELLSKNPSDKKIIRTTQSSAGSKEYVTKAENLLKKQYNIQ